MHAVRRAFEHRGPTPPTSRFAALDALDAEERAALLDETNGALAGRVRDFRLTGRLLAIYRAASWRQRSRTSRSWLQWVAVFSVLTCVLDYLVMGTPLWTSIATRALLIPIVYGILIWIWLRPRATWIEGATLVVAVATMMCTAELIGLAGGAAIHERYLSAGVFATATAIVVFPIGIGGSIAGGAVVLGLYLTFGLTSPHIPPIFPVMLTVFYGFVIGCLVPARQVMNIVIAHAFVLSLRNHLQADVLAEANARLAILANTDGLTGIANRRAVEVRLDAACAGSDAVGVALLDVDFFKRFNDSAGHAAGDRCLVAVADAVSRALPPGATAGRYGGEEFIAIVPGARPVEMVEIGERIRALVADLAIPHPGLPPGRRVSVSVGVAVAAPGTGRLVQAADAALYEAKGRGRDRVVAAWTLPAPEEWRGCVPPCAAVA